MSDTDPKPGDCYARRWYDVEREREQSHVTVRMLGMGVDKPLVGVTLCGTWGGSHHDAERVQ